MDSRPILFFEPEDDYGWLGALSPHPVAWEGQIWPTAEHLFQAMKFTDPDIRATIRGTPLPRQAKAFAKTQRQAYRPDWETQKLAAFRLVTTLKFSQHPDLAEALAATGDRPLIEHCATDDFWADGGGQGENWAGRILMEVRRKL